MSFIERIERLSHPGVFHDFRWPNELHSFDRYNLIYGWNGSGKTTISRMLRSLEMEKVPEQGNVTFIINGHSVKSTDFCQFPFYIRVFNRDYIDNSIFPVGGGDIPLIYVVGKENVDMQKEINRLQIKHFEAQATSESRREAKQQADNRLDLFCIDRALAIKNMLRSAGFNPYNNYDKRDFKNNIQSIIDDINYAGYVLSDNRRNNLLSQIVATQKHNIARINYSIPDLIAIAASTKALVETTIMASTIECINNDPVLAAWIHRGLGLHKDRSSRKCLFCEQDFPSERLSALEGHFTSEYEQLLLNIDNHIKALEEEIILINNMRLPNRAEFYDDMAPEYDDNMNRLIEMCDSVKDYMVQQVSLLKKKKSRPLDEIIYDVPPMRVDYGAIESINDIITRHNGVSEEFEVRINEARKQLEADILVGSLNQYKELINKCELSERGYQEASESENNIKAKIDQLTREMQTSRKSAEELNVDLLRYLGHDELRVEVREAGYSITRRGDPVQALSEGERTAIALLYFLKSLEDDRFKLQRGVVVLDDPVSSLDANSLYLAFGFIRERAEKAAQLFIFTHNFTFFRLVKNWFHKIKKQRSPHVERRPARFFMLDCLLKEGQRRSRIKELDPLLENYESEYHYIFAKIYREANADIDTNLEMCYVMPNVARRLLEAFLTFHYPSGSEKLEEKLEKVKFDVAKKHKLIRFLHTSSHSDAIGAPEHDISSLAETRSVLADLMDLIKSEDPRHYNAMLEII